MPKSWVHVQIDPTIAPPAIRQIPTSRKYAKNQARSRKARRLKIGRRTRNQSNVERIEVGICTDALLVLVVGMR